MRRFNVLPEVLPSPEELSCWAEQDSNYISLGDAVLC